MIQLWMTLTRKSSSRSSILWCIKWVLLLITTFWLSSCGRFPIDETSAPIDAHFNTLPIKLCGEQSYGINGCSYSANDDLENKFLELKLVGRGSYTLRSSNCNFEISQRYRKTKTVRYSLGELLQYKSPETITCVFSILNRPDKFDRAMKANIYLYNLEEFEAAEAKVLNRSLKNGVSWIQVREDSSKKFEINFPVEKDGIIYYDGCGISGSKKFDGYASLSLEDLYRTLPLKVSSSCAFTYYVVPYNGQITTGLFVVNVYRKNYIHLPAPAFRFKRKKRLCVYSDKRIVAVVGINSKFRKARRSVCSTVYDKMAWVQMATANGRTFFAGVKQGEIVWRPLVK